MASRFREVNDEGVEEDVETDDEETVDAFEHGTGILGAKSLLRVASSLSVRGSPDRPARGTPEDLERPRAKGDTGGSPGAGPFGDDPGAAATMAVAKIMAATGGDRLPPSLVRLMSPYQAHYRELRTLGKGGFGSVVSAMGRLDARAVAVKKINFRSAVPPWAKNDALEAMHEEILREARALALMDHPRVVKYHSAWIEPRWSKLASVGKTKTSRPCAVITELDSDADDAHHIGRPSLIFPDVEAESSDESDWDDDDFATESTDASASVSASRRRHLLAPVSPAPPENATSSSGIGYGELWTPAAAAAAALRWPYTLHVAMELCPGSTLGDWIRLRPRGDVQLGAGTHIFRCLVEALGYVHAHGIIHRDVKPANVLVHRGVSDIEPEVKLMDFGLAVFSDGRRADPSARREPDANAPSESDHARRFTVGVGTASYCAPEQRRGSGLYTSSVDMYSAGVVLVEMLAPLGADATESERLRMIAEAKCLNLPDEVTAKFPRHAALARELLSADPRERPTAAGVLRRWPRVNLRLGDGAANGLAGARGGAAAAAAAGAAAAAAIASDGGERAVETAAMTAALDSFAATRTQSLPETDLAAIADAVRAAAEMTTARRSPLTPGDENALGDERTAPERADVDVDVETASRENLAAEVRRLRERLARLERG